MNADRPTHGGYPPPERPPGWSATTPAELLERQAEALLIAAEAELAEVRDEALLSTVNALRRMANGLADALGAMVVLGREGELPDEQSLEGGSAALVSWRAADAALGDLLRSL